MSNIIRPLCPYNLINSKQLGRWKDICLRNLWKEEIKEHEQTIKKWVRDSE